MLCARGLPRQDYGSLSLPLNAVIRDTGGSGVSIGNGLLPITEQRSLLIFGFGPVIRTTTDMLTRKSEPNIVLTLA